MSASEAYRAEAQNAVRDVRRRAAVAAAIELFADRGFHATAMADIAREAGVSLKTMYATFESKEALFSAVLEEVGRRFSVLFDDDAEHPDPTERLLAFVDRIVGLIAENATALRLYQRGADGVPAVMRERGEDPFAGFTERVHRHLAAIVREVQTEGSAAGLDPNLVARALVTLAMTEARRTLDAQLPITEAANDLRALLAALLR